MKGKIIIECEDYKCIIDVVDTGGGNEVSAKFEPELEVVTQRSRAEWFVANASFAFLQLMKGGK